MFDKLRDKLSSSTPEDSDEVKEEEEKEAAESVSRTQKAKTLLKGKRVLDEDELESHLDEIRLILLENNVAMEAAEEIIDQVKDDLYGDTERIGKSSASRVQEAVENSIVSVLSGGSNQSFLDRVDASEKPFVVMFTGINGVGKTTTIAKFSQMLEEEGYSSVMANGDTYRAGAQEQIQEHANNLNTKLIAHEQGGDPTAVLYDAVEYAEANDVDVVLGDTAGRLHTSDDLMTQLDKMTRVVDPDMTLFVDEAVAGQDAINRAQDFNSASELNGVVLTKADADDNGGAVLSLPHLLNTPVFYLGVGQGYDDLDKFDPEEIAHSLLTSRENPD